MTNQALSDSIQPISGEMQLIFSHKTSVLKELRKPQMVQ
jgi:hypothetical protein